jgi:hypothetical protein
MIRLNDQVGLTRIAPGSKYRTNKVEWIENNIHDDHRAYIRHKGNKILVYTYMTSEEHLLYRLKFGTL